MKELVLDLVLPLHLLLDPLESPLVPVVAGVETDEGPGEGVVHQAGDVHRGETGPSRHHNQPAGISKYHNQVELRQ